MKALVCIDVQNDFISGALGSDAAKAITPKIIEYAQSRRARGYALYATRDTHQKTTYEIRANDDDRTDEQVAEAGYFTTLEGKKLPVEHCIKGTTGWQLADGLAKDQDGDVLIPAGHIIDKLTFGSLVLPEALNGDFKIGYEEPLEEIQICGFCTDICVVSNALMLRAAFPDVKITILEDLCAGTSDEAHTAALTVMKSCQIDVAKAFA